MNSPIDPTDLLFLEPPHSHDPRAVSHIAELPASILTTLPGAIQDALYTLQESTSIVYASYLRLQELLDDRFERLTTISGGYSETSFFNYTNALSAERSYLLEDAHPDWKHKARLLSAFLSPTSDLNPAFSLPCLDNQTTTISHWMHQLQQAESLWIQSARDSEVPDFESTVLEYESLSESESLTSTPSEASFSDDDAAWNVPVAAMRKVSSNVVKRDGAGVGHLLAQQRGLGPERIQRALEAL